MKDIDIKKAFNILAVDDDLLMSKKGDVGLVYKVMLPQIYSLDSDQMEQISVIFDKVIRSLPAGTILQKQDFFFVDSIKEQVSDSPNFLSASDNRFFHEKPTMSHECYLTIIKDSKSKVSILNNSSQYNKYLDGIDDFIKAVESSLSFLTKEGFFAVERLNSNQIIALLGKYLSLSKEGETNLRDMFFDKNLQIGNKFAELYTISSNNQLPITINSTIKSIEYSTPKTDFRIPFIQPVSTGLDVNHIYNQVIFIEDSEKVFSSLKTKMNQFKSMAILSRENQVTYSQVEDLVEDVLERELTFVYQHFSVIVWNVSQKKLEHDVNLLENAFRDLGITPYQVKYALNELYMNNCPGAPAYISENHKFIGISEQTSSLLNFESYYESNKDGILFCDRKNESPLRLDLWDEPVKKGIIVNRNRLIFGPSGTGKSFLINHIASQYYEQGHHIVMIDIGNSYKKLCELVEGVYFTYDLNSPLQFNPFYYYDEDEINIDKKTFLLSLIFFLWKGEEGASREEKQILSTYLDLYYEYVVNNDVFPSMATFYEFISENTAVEEESSYFDKVSFKLSLRDFYDGHYKDILNAAEPANLIHERFIVFEMDNIKDHPTLFPLVTMLCINLVMTKIQKIPGVKKSIFIDECWKPISKGEMAEFIKYLYKTVRKFYGEVAIATQDLEDILDTAAGPAMVNNTDTLIMLSHKKKMASKDKFSKYLSLSESDLQKLYSTDKGEVYVKVGSMSNVYKVKVSPERYACYSSNADENKVIRGIYEAKGNMSVAINDFIDLNSQKK